MAILLHKIIVAELATLYFVSNGKLEFLKFSLLNHNKTQVYVIAQLSVDHAHHHVQFPKFEVVVSPKIECLAHLLL